MGKLEAYILYVSGVTKALMHGNEQIWPKERKRHMNTSITTVLFDLDGTLINTNDLIIASFTHTLNHYFPSKYSREDILQFMGPTLEESFHIVDPNQVEEMVAHYREHNMKHHDSLVTEFEGVFETITALKAAGYKIGIVTTKIRDAVLRGLKVGRLESFFEVVITLDDVQHAKPDPEPIHLALEKLHSKPEETIMVGDNHHDILAGKNAGTQTAGVAWTIKGKEYLNTFGPDYMLDNMRDLLQILKVDDDEENQTLPG